MTRYTIRWAFDWMGGVFECEAKNEKRALSKLFDDLRRRGVISSSMDIYKVQTKVACKS